jgi:hypothetical protein
VYKEPEKASTSYGGDMNVTQDLKEIVWKQLIDYIQTEDLFFPFKIRNQVSEDAHETFEEFLQLLLEHKMLIEFKKKSFFNRIAHWIFKRKIKERDDKDQLAQIYVKGPNWEENKAKSYAEITGQDAPKKSETVH